MSVAPMWQQRLSGHYVLKNSQNGKLTGAFIDSKLNFQYHIEKFCAKLTRKLPPL